MRRRRECNLNEGLFGLRLAGSPLGLPADFLIAPSGRINAVKYGIDAYDYTAGVLASFGGSRL